MQKLLNMLEVAEILGVTKERAYALGRKGLIPIVRIGRQMRVEPGALESWFASGGQSGASG